VKRRETGGYFLQFVDQVLTKIKKNSAKKYANKPAIKKLPYPIFFGITNRRRLIV
jgi:hypothetical protein